MKAPPPDADPPIDRLVKVMALLRDRTSGCAWDLEQTFASVAPYTIEEAYEVADAIERGDLDDLKEELGDLLFQVVFHARMAEEVAAFDFNEVAETITEKMIRRHPHVFADANVSNLAEQTRAWEDAKAAERRVKGAGWLDAVATTLPALTRATKLSARAARVGFVWPTVTEILAKLAEEIGELEAEIEAGDLVKARAELGDVLFVCANIARALDVDPEHALRITNAKFVRRFSYIESALKASGRNPAEATLAEMDRLWDEAKAAEKA